MAVNKESEKFKEVFGEVTELETQLLSLYEKDAVFFDALKCATGTLTKGIELVGDSNKNELEKSYAFAIMELHAYLEESSFAIDACITPAYEIKPGSSLFNVSFKLDDSQSVSDRFPLPRLASYVLCTQTPDRLITKLDYGRPLFSGERVPFIEKGGKTKNWLVGSGLPCHIEVSEDDYVDKSHVMMRSRSSIVLPSAIGGKNLREVVAFLNDVNETYDCLTLKVSANPDAKYMLM